MISHPDLRWKRCDVKSTNLLGNVLAMEAARRAGCHEAVLIDSAGFVTEATHSSLNLGSPGSPRGTPEGHEILPGMTRQHILRLVQTLEIPFVATRVTLPELLAADEVILFGTTIEVLPVVRIDDQRSTEAGQAGSRVGSTGHFATNSRAGWPAGIRPSNRCGAARFRWELK